MAATLAPISLSTPRVVSMPKQSSQLPQLRVLSFARLRAPARGLSFVVASSPSTPPGISDKVEESIKKAEEACAGDAESGECVAAWDEVEELSAAASHARDKIKDSDPLDNYCADNPEADECRTYDN